MKFARLSQIESGTKPAGVGRVQYPTPTAETVGREPLRSTYKHGDHIADHICPRGQKQQPCDCPICAYWRNKYPSGG